MMLLEMKIALRTLRQIYGRKFTIIYVKEIERSKTYFISTIAVSMNKDSNA